MPGIRMSETRQATLARTGESEKTRGIFERGRGVPRGVQQILRRVADRPVVVDDSNERPFGHVTSRMSVSVARLAKSAIARRRDALTPWYKTLVGARQAEPVGHAHQLGNRVRLHLAHDLPAMDFHGDDAQAELGCDALVHPPRDDVAP